nr:cytochrome P450 [Allosaccharopolyspora coralli]
MPLPVIVICELLGVPHEDRAQFEQWSEAFTSLTKLSRQEIEDYGVRMYGYMGELIAQRRQDPQDDLISALVFAQSDQGRMSEEELMLLCVGILVAGHETTGSQISNFVYLLLQHPELLAQLQSDLDLVPSAVEELLRHVPLGASSVFPRYATEDVDIGGVTVGAGDPVLVSLPAANRDRSVFSESETLLLDRHDNPHVTFGHGPHHCLGAHLARVELQVAVRTLLERLPGLRLAVPEPKVRWKTGLLVRGPLELPLDWDSGRDS